MSRGREKNKGKTESPRTKILVAIVIALISGGTAPWWWNSLVHRGPEPESAGEVLVRASQIVVHEPCDRGDERSSGELTWRVVIGGRQFDSDGVQNVPAGTPLELASIVSTVPLSMGLVQVAVEMAEFDGEPARERDHDSQAWTIHPSDFNEQGEIRKEIAMWPGIEDPSCDVRIVFNARLLSS